MKDLLRKFRELFASTEGEFEAMLNDLRRTRSRAVSFFGLCAFAVWMLEFMHKERGLLALSVGSPAFHIAAGLFTAVGMQAVGVWLRAVSLEQRVRDADSSADRAVENIDLWAKQVNFNPEERAARIDGLSLRELRELESRASEARRVE